MYVTLCLSGPLWASLGFSQQPASSPASQPPKRRTASLVVIPPASQPASSLVVILLVGRLPGRNSTSGEPPWSKFCLWRASLVVCNSACGEALGFKWIYICVEPNVCMWLFIVREICGEPPWLQISWWEASSQAHDRLVRSTTRLFGPLWSHVICTPVCTYIQTNICTQASLGLGRAGLCMYVCTRVCNTHAFTAVSCCPPLAASVNKPGRASASLDAS